MTIIVFFLLVIGLMFPIVALCLGALNFVCRWIFVFGYKKGANWRLIGGMPVNLSIFAMCALSIVSCSMFIAQIPKVE